MSLCSKCSQKHLFISVRFYKAIIPPLPRTGMSLCPWSSKNPVPSLAKQHRDRKWKVSHYLFWLQSDSCCCTNCAFPSLLTHLISSFWQCAQPGQFCFILIAYFRLKKLVFLDYFDVEMGAGEQFAFIRQYVFPLRSFVLTAEFLFIYWQWN